MLKWSKKHIAAVDKDYPGIAEQIYRFEAKELPSCPYCKSDDTALVQVGVIQRTINIVAATTKVKLIGNGPKKGTYFCNQCRLWFS